MSDEVYCYPPGYSVLKNLLDIREADRLERAERRFVAERLIHGAPGGEFDLGHLQTLFASWRAV